MTFYLHPYPYRQMARRALQNRERSLDIKRELGSPGITLASWLLLDWFEIAVHHEHTARRARAGPAGRPAASDRDEGQRLPVVPHRRPTVRDGVDSSTRPASRTFPYLAPPNPDPPQPPKHL